MTGIDHPDAAGDPDPLRRDDAGRAAIGVALRSIRNLGGAPLVRKMIESFLPQLATRMAAARTGLEAGDLAAVLFASHTLKSSAAQLGAVRMRALSAEVEARAKEGADGLAPLLDELEEEMGRVRELLERELGKGESAGLATVAIVDADADSRLILAMLLESRYAVVEYPSGAAALAGLREARPDLILLDVALADMDSAELLLAIHAEETLRRVPVIALTRFDIRGGRGRYLQAGFADYLTRPFGPDAAFVRAIQSFLGQC